jgi:hypothetical protein
MRNARSDREHLRSRSRFPVWMNATKAKAEGNQSGGMTAVEAAFEHGRRIFSRRLTLRHPFPSLRR